MKKITLNLTTKHLYYMLGIACLTTVYAFAPGGGDQIQTANRYFNNNQNLPTAQRYGGDMKAITISSAQVNAINEIRNEVNPPAYRVYFAKDDAGNNTSIVVGVNNNGYDISSSARISASQMFDRCPVECDEASQITAE